MEPTDKPKPQLTVSTVTPPAPAAATPPAPIVINPTSGPGRIIAEAAAVAAAAETVAQVVAAAAPSLGLSQAVDGVIAVVAGVCMLVVRFAGELLGRSSATKTASAIAAAKK